jgi:hypothetical protein
MIIRRTLSLVSLAITLSSTLAAAQSVDHTDVGAMVGAINAERARTSLPALTEDPRLDAIAESHSMEMARAHFFSHVSPSTGQPAERVTHAGLHWTTVAENIAINQSPSAAQQALLVSPGHHENMVDPAQRAVGIGIVRHGEQVWVTQLFAALTDPPAAPMVTPVTSVTPVAPMAPAALAAHPPAAAPVAQDADDDSADGEADETTDDTVAPTPPAAPLTFPALPVQGIPGLEQFLTGLGLSRRAPPPAGRAAVAAPQVYTIQTPFGPVRVEVPSTAAMPTAAATPAAPVAAPRSARPAPHRPASRSPRAAPARGRVVEIDTLDV